MLPSDFDFGLHDYADVLPLIFGREEAMAFIEFKDVVKKFNGVAVLDGLDLKIEKGDLVCIVGHSGTGKSVTLKHIVRLLSPTSGSVFVDGVDVASCSESALTGVRRRIGYLFQGGALLAWKTLGENVALPLVECTDLSDEEISQRVRKALEDVELLSSIDKYPSEISGGMLKRAALARAIVRETDVLLCDEPTSGLDPVTSMTINNLIRRINKARGITSVVVTHDLKGAFAIADKIVLLDGSRVALCATPDDFVKSQNPAAREFVAATQGGVI